MKLQKLTEAESAVLKKIWEMTSPVTSSALLKEFAEERGWKPQTMNTFLSNLTEKRYLTCERRGTTNYYTPAVSRREYEEITAKEMLDDNFGGSVRNMVASLADSGRLTESDIAELKKWFDERY